VQHLQRSKVSRCKSNPATNNFSLKQQNFTIIAMAKVLGRPPSTITREFKRNTCQNQYASRPVDQRCKQRRIDGRPSAMRHADSILFGVVRHFLSWHWSAQQIALQLAASYPKGHEDRVSTEPIYNCIYAQPVGELRRELIACLPQAKTKRAPRSKGQDKRGQIPSMVSIHLRLPEIEDRQFPGHREGVKCAASFYGQAAGHS
jgi:IS30 family transposase